MAKTHLLVTEGDLFGACGRKAASGYRISSVPSRVDCGSCRNRPEWQEAHEAALAAIEAAFEAQTPHTVVPQFGRVNDDGVMECSHDHEGQPCGSILWRERPRDLWSYHYVCENGHSVRPLTETGMCQ